MSRRLLVRLLLLGLVALALWVNQARSRGAPSLPQPPVPTASMPGAASAQPELARPQIGFRDHSRLAEHYGKHGAEFGAITEAEYLLGAQRLRDRASGGDILEARRGDGVITRFDRKTGDFLAFDPDLTIRTYFRPNDGEAYFRRQLRRLPSSP